MKVNEGMRDAVESIVEQATFIDGKFDSYPDNVTMTANDAHLIEKAIERLTLSLHHLHRCERLNNK
jgi:hypothetical protein